MIGKNETDVVSIVLPTYLHEEVAVSALDGGKHVLLEKPMALDGAGCDRILAAAKRNGKILNVAHEFRFSIQWGPLKNISMKADWETPSICSSTYGEDLIGMGRTDGAGIYQKWVVDQGGGDSLL